jgi:hypothetical protein
MKSDSQSQKSVVQEAGMSSDKHQPQVASEKVQINQEPSAHPHPHLGIVPSSIYHPSFNGMIKNFQGWTIFVDILYSNEVFFPSSMDDNLFENKWLILWVTRIKTLVSNGQESIHRHSLSGHQRTYIASLALNHNSEGAI